MSTNETTTVDNYSLEYTIKFAVLLALEIPSILISLLIFTYFASNRNRAERNYNYSILVLLVVNFLQVTIDLPMPMSFFNLHGVVQQASSTYCIWWTWYEFSLNTVNGFLMAWISLERHIYIFHSNFIRNLGTWKRRLFHIVPLIVCCTWGPLFYAFAIIINPICTNTWYFNSLLCGMPCYLFTNLGTFDLFFDVISPVLSISTFNLALIIRVIHHQCTTAGRVQNNWQRQKKMAFQLALISTVYLTVWIPLSVIQLGQIYIDPNFLSAQLNLFNYLVYIVPLILPMVCLLSMPQLIKKVKALILRQRRDAVRPTNDLSIARGNKNFPVRPVITINT